MGTVKTVMSLIGGRPTPRDVFNDFLDLGGVARHALLINTI